MSIRKQIALHPASKDHVNQSLGDAVHHLMYASKMCLSCADACMAEAMDMAQCIRLCLDCVDVCAATAGVIGRQTDYDANVARPLLEACVAICKSCGDECERHAHMPHCRICAEACRRCEQACRDLLDATK